MGSILLRYRINKFCFLVIHFNQVALCRGSDPLLQGRFSPPWPPVCRRHGRLSVAAMAACLSPSMATDREPEPLFAG